MTALMGLSRTVLISAVVSCLLYAVSTLPGYAQGSMEGLLDETASTAGYAPGGSSRGLEPIAVAGRIVNVASSFIGILFLCYTVYGGFLWLTAAGNDDKVDKAKKIIRDGVIGIIIILSAVGINLLLLSVFAGAPAEPTA